MMTFFYLPLLGLALRGDSSFKMKENELYFVKHEKVFILTVTSFNQLIHFSQKIRVDFPRVTPQNTQQCRFWGFPFSSE